METTGMKAIGYRKSLPIEAPDALIDFETAKPEPKGRDIPQARRSAGGRDQDFGV
jgi:hypothetical protein